MFACETRLSLHLRAIQCWVPGAYLTAFIRSVFDTSEAEKVVEVEDEVCVCVGGEEKKQTQGALMRGR